MAYEFEYEDEFSDQEAKEIVSMVKIDSCATKLNEEELLADGRIKELVAYYMTHRTTDKETFKKVAEYVLGSGNISLIMDLSLFKNITDSDDEEMNAYKRRAEKQIVLTSELENADPKKLSEHCITHKIEDLFTFRAIAYKVIKSGDESALMNLPHAMNFKNCDKSNKELLYLKRLIENAILTKSRKSSSNISDGAELTSSN